MTIAAVIGSIGEARAQVDLNLQSRINVFSPPITAVEIAPQTAPTVYTIKTPTGPKCVSKSEARDYIKSHPQFIAQSLKRAGIRTQDKASADVAAEACLNDRKCLEKFGVGPIPINWACPKQPPTLKFTFLSNPTYETNVLKSNQNIQSDTSLGFVGSGLFTTAGLRDYDIIAFSAGTASARYSAFPSKSFDNLSVQGLYQFFLDAYTVDGKPITHPPKSEDNGNMITYDVLAIGFVNQTAFVPTFHTETANLLTPQVTLAHQNMGLLGLSDPGCAPLFNPNWPTPLQPGYCYFANISVTAGQTFSDVVTLQNANVALAGTVSKRFDQTDWVLSLAGMATAKSFEDVPGGRQDLLLQLGPQLTYTPSKCVSFSVSVTYYRNYSSLSTAAWDGVIIQPTFNVIFPVEPPPDKGHTICG
jgi:hypothetical protein